MSAFVFLNYESFFSFFFQKKKKKELASLWEKMRRRNIAKDDRSKYVSIEFSNS